MVLLQAGIHINFVMDLNRLLKHTAFPGESTCFVNWPDARMVICNFIYRFHDNVYNLYGLWLNSKLITVVLLFNRDFIFFLNVKYIQEYIAKL